MTLASQALHGAAMEFWRSQSQATQGRVHPREHLQQHAELCRILGEGEIISADRNTPSEFGHESYMVQVRQCAAGLHSGEYGTDP
jgi:hypothetical protein